MERLCGFENVKLFDFQGEETVILDLDHYMDPIHFSADVNHWMVLEAGAQNPDYLETEKNREEKLAHMETLARETIPGRMEELLEKEGRADEAAAGGEAGA